MEKGLKELAILSFLEGKDGGGGDAPSGTKEITVNQNGTTTHDVESYKNAKIIASVPNSYSASDEGKVVSEGELVAQGSATYTSNGTYDTTEKSSVTVAVPGSSPSGTKQISISSNGTTTEDVSAYASAQIAVSVPNSYAAGDEGKVVSNGALVAQGSDTVTQNGTVNTTLISSLLVNVSGGGSTIYSGTRTFATRPAEDVEFECPGATHFCIWLAEDADLTTGVGFVYSICADSNYAVMAYSNRAGTSGQGTVRYTISDGGETKISIQFTTDGVVAKYSNISNFRFFLAQTYNWVAW